MTSDIEQILERGRALQQAGRLDEAGGLYRQLLAVDPNHADALHLLGVVAYQGGRNDLALELIGKAITRNDRVADFHCNIGNVLGTLGRLGEAEAHYRRAIGLNPTHAESHNNLGNALKDQGQLDEAEGQFRHALALRPGYAEAHYNLGNVLLDQSRTEEAVSHYRQAIGLNPGMATAHYNLGHALKVQGNPADAVECYQQAISLRPDWADVHNNLGTVLYDLDRLAEAEACFRRALAILPENATAFDNLATTLRTAGGIEEAITYLKRALAINPDGAVAHTNLIFALNFVSTATAAEHQAERARWDEQHARRFADLIRPHTNEPDPQRRLRIGYVSSHFCHQAATFAFAGVILHHDREQFEVICYSDTAREDAITERLRAGADMWRCTARLTDEKFAELIRTDGVDILVDLVGHMSGHRLLVFARKPAPIQVTAWGEPTGTGLKTMDYLLSDPVLVPAGERGLLAETVVNLPNFLGYWVAEPLPAPGALPALARGHVTFGSFNRLDKIQDAVVQTWAAILRALPKARIVIKNRWFGDPAHRDRIVALFADNGVAPERVDLLSSTARAGHFSAYGGIDLALDPFPHGGGMTTLDALWMGVPVVAFSGRTISSRLAAASLTAIGLTDFIAADLDGYVALAIAKACDLDALARLRASLRSRVATSDFGDPVRYGRAVELAFRQMWQRWCAGRSDGLTPAKAGENPPRAQITLKRGMNAGTEHPVVLAFDGLIGLRRYAQTDPDNLAARFATYCAAHLMQSSAQLLQDLFVLFFLNGKRNGFFVEFGATDGLLLSNTLLLERDFQWNGILAEPAKSWHAALKKNRSASIDTRCVWSRTGASLAFKETDAAEFSTISQLLDKDFNRETRKGPGRHYAVDTISLGDLLADHQSPKSIDYLSIDTEGSELEILRTFDFGRYEITIITVEHNYCEPDRRQINELLTANGFVRVFEALSKFDDWYVKRAILSR